MSIGTSATFETSGPHAAVVHADGEEIGRARFYVTAEDADRRVEADASAPS